MKLLIATSNLGKFREIMIALADLPVELKSLKDLTNLAKIEPEETGTTFAENAKIKAEYWCHQTGLPTLADDSGILVDALPGELGVNTVRWGAGKDATDKEWLEHFLNQLNKVRPEKRSAEFICTLALSRPDHPTEYFEGRVRGQITGRAEAPILSGIPLSSVFRPGGSTKVFASMTEAEKEKYSHRGQALAKAKEFLRELLYAQPLL